MNQSPMIHNYDPEAIKALYQQTREDNKSPGVEITQAEYDALPEEKKNCGIMYFIIDAEPDTSDTHVELTLEAYNSLPESEKMSGKIFFIKDAYSDVSPIIVGLSQEAYDALPDSEKNNGKLYLISDANKLNTIKATEIFDKMNPKGEVTMANLPASGSLGDFYFVLDRQEGVYWDGGQWRIVK